MSNHDMGAKMPLLNDDEKRIRRLLDKLVKEAIASAAAPPALAYGSMDEFCAAAGISRTEGYNQVKEGHLVPTKVGRRTIIPIAEANRWLAARSRPPVDPEPPQLKRTRPRRSAAEEARR